MIYGAVLAAGSGTRMGNTQKPKQFLSLGKKPILIHTLEKFLCIPEFETVYLGVQPDWIPYCQDLIAQHLGSNSRIRVVAGGKTRNETIFNITSDIHKRCPIADDDIIVTHDAVRPFVTGRIIKENIEAAQKYGACDTAVKCSDTIVQSADGSMISFIPDRSQMYSGQTPQSFRISLLIDSFSKLTPSEKEILTDACKILVLKGENVFIVEGDLYNFKITTQYDYKMAQAMFEGTLND
jgi:D-ribitol-5-phosphate cytidylyltransferase